MNEKLSAARDYPMASKRPELILTPTGRKLSDITIDNVLSGEVKPEDCRICEQTLEYQAQIAESQGSRQIAFNLRRAAELTKIPDQRILEIYNAMRPYRSSKNELLAIADELESRYEAKLNAAFIKEAARVYEVRKKLKGDK